jgi:hypothetical protein
MTVETQAPYCEESEYGVLLVCRSSSEITILPTKPQYLANSLNGDGDSCGNISWSDIDDCIDGTVHAGCDEYWFIKRVSAKEVRAALAGYDRKKITGEEDYD